MTAASRLFLGVPTADGIVMAGFVAALAGMVSSLQRAGIESEYASLDGQDVALQRNALVRRFLESGCTHFLSLDSDMTFPPDLAGRLLAFDKPVIGTIYSKRALDLARLRQHAETRPLREAFALAHDWNLRLDGASLRMEGDICRVAAVPTGFLLIRRDVLERLGSRPGEAEPFDEMLHDGEVLDGDYAFCRRAVALGETIWAYPAADLGHLGDWRGVGTFGAALRSRAAAPRGTPA